MIAMLDKICYNILIKANIYYSFLCNYFSGNLWGKATILYSILIRCFKGDDKYEQENTI